MNEKQQVLNLTNICDGKLEAEFEEMYKDALRKISKGQKAKITINIENVTSSRYRYHRGTWLQY